MSGASLPTNRFRSSNSSCAGLLPDRPGVGNLHVVVFFRGPLEEPFDFAGEPGAVLPLQLLEVLLAEQQGELRGELRPVLDLVEPLPAVVQVLGQRQAGQPAGLLVRALFQDGAQEHFVFPRSPP